MDKASLHVGRISLYSALIMLLLTGWFWGSWFSYLGALVPQDKRSMQAAIAT